MATPIVNNTTALELLKEKANNFPNAKAAAVSSDIRTAPTVFNSFDIENKDDQCLYLNLNKGETAVIDKDDFDKTVIISSAKTETDGDKCCFKISFGDRCINICAIN